MRLFEKYQNGRLIIQFHAIFGKPNDSLPFEFSTCHLHLPATLKCASVSQTEPKIYLIPDASQTDRNAWKPLNKKNYK